MKRFIIYILFFGITISMYNFKFIILLFYLFMYVCMLLLYWLFFYVFNYIVLNCYMLKE